jgi:hypothetical protein
LGDMAELLRAVQDRLFAALHVSPHIGPC